MGEAAPSSLNEIARFLSRSACRSNPLALTAIQVLHGVTGAVIGVMTALVSADVTKGTEGNALRIP